MNSQEMLAALAEPFPTSDIRWRVGSTNKKRFEAGLDTTRKGLPLAYIDARDVMDRLDSVVGPENWRDSYHDTPKRLFCKVEIRIGDEWVGKTDGAGDTDMEGEKGGISDSFKRAAVKWGIGRYLYGCKTPWVELTDRWALTKKFDGSQYLSPFSSKQMRTKYWKALRDGAANNDAGAIRELWDELSNEQKQALWHDLSSGIRSTIKELLNSTGVEAL